MCYRCEVCSDVVAHGTPMMKHITYRDKPMPAGGIRTEIAREVKLCAPCKGRVDDGESIQSLFKWSSEENMRQERATEFLRSQGLPTHPQPKVKVTKKGGPLPINFAKVQGPIKVLGREITPSNVHGTEVRKVPVKKPRKVPLKPSPAKRIMLEDGKCD